MKNHFFISIFILLFFGIVALHQSKKNTNLIFTGKYFSYFEDGNTYSERNYLRGKLHGDYILFNPNGTIKSIYRYNMGKFED